MCAAPFIYLEIIFKADKSRNLYRLPIDQSENLMISHQNIEITAMIR